MSDAASSLRTLDGDVAADWLIVGAGFAGLSAARRLQALRPGEKIVLLDAGEIGKGTSGRNSGFMIDVPHNLSAGEYSSAGADATRVEMAQNRFAIAFAKGAADEYGMSRETFDPAGKINAAATARGMTLNASFGESLAFCRRKTPVSRRRGDAGADRLQLLSRWTVHARLCADPSC
jgi:glycine/D-amino acid oxidase-like deaminating enzyme